MEGKRATDRTRKRWEVVAVGAINSGRARMKVFREVEGQDRGGARVDFRLSAVGGGGRFK